MSDYEVDGQINFSDFFKPTVKEKPKLLVEFINGMGTAQYTQIGNVIRKTCECGNYDMPAESIERITNNVSVWLLDIGSQYQKYLLDCLKIADTQPQLRRD